MQNLTIEEAKCDAAAKERDLIVAWLRSEETQRKFDEIQSSQMLNHHPLDLLAFAVQIGSHYSDTGEQGK